MHSSFMVLHKIFMLRFKLYHFVPDSGNEKLTFFSSSLLYEEKQPNKMPSTSISFAGWD